jgi:DNA polymerase III epsilon subunit-like protein
MWKITKKSAVLYMEGENKRFYDFFKDIKPGYFVIHSELNDVAELKKEFSNMARMGGLKLDLLGYAHRNNVSKKQKE